MRAVAELVDDARTRSRVSGRTRCGALSTLETVCRETPAARRRLDGRRSVGRRCRRRWRVRLSIVRTDRYVFGRAQCAAVTVACQVASWSKLGAIPAVCRVRSSRIGAADRRAPEPHRPRASCTTVPARRRPWPARRARRRRSAPARRRRACSHGDRAGLSARSWSPSTASSREASASGAPAGATPRRTGRRRARLGDPGAGPDGLARAQPPGPRRPAAPRRCGSSTTSAAPSSRRDRCALGRRPRRRSRRSRRAAGAPPVAPPTATASGARPARRRSPSRWPRPTRSTRDGRRSELRWTVDVPAAATRAGRAGGCTVTDAGAAVVAAAADAGVGRARVDRRRPPARRAGRTASLDDLQALLLADRRAPGRRLPGGRRALVPHAVRPRLALGGADAAAAAAPTWPRGTLRTLAAPAGHRPTTRRPGRSRARSCTRSAGDRLAGRRRRRCRRVYYGTVDATPLWVCLLARRLALGPARGRGRERCCPRCERGAGLAGRPRRLRRRRLPRVHRPQRPRPGQPGLEGLRRLGPVRRRPARRRPDRAGEVQALRATRPRSAAPPCSTRSAGPAATAGGRWAAGLADRFRDDVLGRRRRRPLPGASRWTATSAPVDASTSQHRPPARHRAARRRTRRADRGRPAGCTRAWTAGLRPAHDVRDRPAATRPLSYHCGSVWPHDTAIAVARAGPRGHDAVAGSLAGGLLAAGEAFDYRLPELYAGDGRTSSGGRCPTRRPAGRRPGPRPPRSRC